MTQPPPLPCNRCSSAIEVGDLRCPVCYLAVSEIASAPETTTKIQALRCRTCGASIEYRVASQAPQCAFCGGVLKLEELIDPQEEIEKRLPFKVDRQQAAEVYQEWISRQGFFRPFNLDSASRLESLRALWWAAWVVDVRALATWTADSDADARKAKWAPHAGEFQTEFSNLAIPASLGLTASECARLAPTYDLAGSGGDPEDAPAEAVQERFDTPRSLARVRIVGVIERLIEARMKNGQIPGTRHRNFHSSIQLRGLNTRRLAFPAYVIAYRYRGRLYRTVISGQDPNCVIGEAPRSIAKLVLLIIAVFLAMGGFALLLRLVH